MHCWKCPNPVCDHIRILDVEEIINNRCDKCGAIIDNSNILEDRSFKMGKIYIAFDDGRLGYVENICTCDQCKKRGMAEMFIRDLNEEFLDSLRIDDVKHVIYIGESLFEAIERISEHYEALLDKKKKENDYLQNVLTFYCDKITKEESI